MAGVVADRFERRVVLLVTDVVRGSIMVAMAWLVGTDGPLWAIVALAILATCFSCFFGPTIGAYLPSLVRDERELGPANSAWSTLDNLAFVIGPAVAALLITASGLTLAFVLNAISFAFVAVILWRLPKEHGRGGGKASTTEKNERSMAAVTGATDVAKPTDTPTEATSATGGGKAIGRTLRSSVGRSLVGDRHRDGRGLVFGGLGVMTVVLAGAQLGADQAATGLLNAAIGIGGILGAIGSSAFVVRPGLRIPLVGGSIALAIGMAMLGVFGSLGPALVAMALASAGNLLIEVVSMTIFQRIVPDPIRGRALGAVATITTLAYATGSLLMPVWSGAFGIGPVFVASGLLVVVRAILAIVLIGRGAIARRPPCRLDGRARGGRSSPVSPSPGWPPPSLERRSWKRWPEARSSASDRPIASS